MVLEVSINSIRELTPTVKEFEIEADNHNFEYDPGNHIRIRYEGNGDPGGMARPYTPTTLPGTNQLTLAIKQYDGGDASTYMHNREEGDRIFINKPTGGFSLQDLERDVVFIATGTGITPMVAMLRQYIEDGTGKAHLLFGEKDREHLIYRELLDGFADAHGNVSVTYSLTDPDSEWDGLTGRVQDHLEELLADFDEKDFYICGVPTMVVDTKEALLAHQTPADRIFTEGWEEGVVQAKSEPLSVYDELGGIDAIESVVDRMYDLILADDRLAPYFDESDVDSLIEHQSEFIAMVAGGPDYHQHIAETHAHMNLQDEHFDTVLAYFHASLAEHDVPEDYIHQLKSRLQEYRSSAVTA